MPCWSGRAGYSKDLGSDGLPWWRVDSALGDISVWNPLGPASRILGESRQTPMPLSNYYNFASIADK